MAPPKMMLAAMAVLVLAVVAYFAYVKMNYRKTKGNNGTASCTTYCANNINGELPSSWNGAKATKAVGTTSGTAYDVGATSAAGDGLTCTCKKAGGGWASSS